MVKPKRGKQRTRPDLIKCPFCKTELPRDVCADVMKRDIMRDHYELEEWIKDTNEKVSQINKEFNRSMEKIEENFRKMNELM